MTQTIVYLDTEGTGLDSITDTVLEISIVNDDGVAVLDSLVRPPESISVWPQAQAIHGITPDMVAGAPTLSELAPQIREAVKDKDVIIYNAAFDTSFLGALLDGARSVQCCMEAWAEHTGEWDDYHQHWRWQRLDRAAEAVCFTWPGKKHRALADSLACRAVWQYLHSPQERERVDALIRDRQLTTEARNILRSDERKAIPDNLHPASYFLRETWFQKELSPAAAYIGKKSGWLLYDSAENARIQALFPLRFNKPLRFPGDALLTRSALLKAGLTTLQVDALPPVTERQNGFSGEWYKLYLIAKNTLPNPGTVPLSCCTPEIPATDLHTTERVIQILKSQQGEHS